MAETHAPPPSLAPSPPAAVRRPGRVWALALLLMAATALGVYYATPRITKALLRENPTQESLFQARQIYNACQAHAAVRGKLPAILDDLVPDFLPDRHALSDPAHPEEGEIGFYYYGSGSTGIEPAESIFLASKFETKEQRVVVRFDGQARVQFLPDKWLRDRTP